MRRVTAVELLTRGLYRLIVRLTIPWWRGLIDRLIIVEIARESVIDRSFVRSFRVYAVTVKTRRT